MRENVLHGQSASPFHLMYDKFKLACLFLRLLPILINATFLISIHKFKNNKLSAILGQYHFTS